VVAVGYGARAGGRCRRIVGALAILEQVGNVVLVPIALYCLFVAGARALVGGSRQLWFVVHGVRRAIVLPV
jgi:hypothetical protein